MKTLITFVSQYDPVSVKFTERMDFGQEISLEKVEKYAKDNIYDGPVLHIIRKEMPNRIIALLSEGMKNKKWNLERAIRKFYPDESQPNFQVIDIGDEVYKFDRMYEEVAKILDRETLPAENDEETEYLLNVTSGTAQCQAAMYAINFIKNYQTKLYRVDSPDGMNLPAPYYSSEAIERLLDKNLDNEKIDNDRSHIETGEKLRSNLLQRTYKDFILKYEYKAALEILKDNPHIISDVKAEGNSEKLLENMVSVFQKQTVLKKIADDDSLQYDDTDEFQKVLNYYLMIDILNRRGQVTDVLVKAKSFAEFVIEKYLFKNYSRYITETPTGFKLDFEVLDSDEVNMICKYINDEYKKQGFKKLKFTKYKKLMIHSFRHLVGFLEGRNAIVTSSQKVSDLNSRRNQVAHGLAEISVKQEELDELVKGLRELVIAVYSDIDASLYQKYFDYYDIKNRELISCIK
ncbi:type III-A CRISPR-associated CARF protein Csm6 [Streptococcus cristatus]|uniref:CRISPR-associated protein Csm6 n=1 Tax=Streptococcus cristatus TaxID=45634 RepID=A0A139MZB7_STRCR|nr:hypothetical protein [Streptococcus cristatus]KXT69126.1 CRISPR-associated protein Csm6 [Streptococcus cristatus]